MRDYDLQSETIFVLVEDSSGFRCRHLDVLFVVAADPNYCLRWQTKLYGMDRFGSSSLQLPKPLMGPVYVPAYRRAIEAFHCVQSSFRCEDTDSTYMLSAP
jgi:hypothetical protein